MSGFRRKVVFHSLTKCCILKLSTNIQPPRRFNLGFLETPRQVYSYSNMRKNFLESFKVYVVFPKKMVLQPCTIIQKLKIQFSLLRYFKMFYRRLPYRGEIFGKFHVLSHFHGKMVLNSLTKLYFLNPFTNIQSQQTNLKKKQTSKQIHSKLQYEEIFFQIFKVYLASSEN